MIQALVYVSIKSYLTKMCSKWPGDKVKVSKKFQFGTYYNFFFVLKYTLLLLHYNITCVKSTAN
jgi:hypothetical protein